MSETTPAEAPVQPAALAPDASNGPPRAELIYPAAIPVSATPAPVPSAAPYDLEQRVRRLEEALAQLQDEYSSAGFREKLASRSEELVRSSHLGLLVQAGQQLLADESTAAAPAPGVVVPRRVPMVRHMLFDLWAEARAVFRMYVDPRHRLTWTGRTIPVCLLVMIVTSGWWFPLAWLPVVGVYVDKVFDVVIAYALYKVVSHESRRYRQISPDLPPSLRL
jgi:hypothetical protein